MKRSIIATLLILVLALSGCKAQQEAGTAAPAERVEAEKKQETSQAVPEESETEQELPAEEEKPVEQEQADEQEKPAEEEEPKGDGSEIVKFWETVPEMSLDEAKEVVRTKLERIESENKIGTLTDEERMALYVFNSSYPELVKDYVEQGGLVEFDDRFSLKILLSEEFKGDREQYLKKYSWEHQESFAEETERCETDITSTCLLMDGKTSIGYQYFKEYSPLKISSIIRIDYPYDTNNIFIHTKEGKIEDCAKLREKVLKHYLSLKQVAFLEGTYYSPVLTAY